MARLVFLQWNVRSVWHKKHDLIFLLNKYKPLVCALAETWLVPSLSFRLPHYNIIRCDRSDGYGGSALCVNNRVPLVTVPLPSVGGDVSIVAGKVEGITLLSIYIAHPNQNFLPLLRNILENVVGPVLVMGDFNCHHFRWGSERCDSFGVGLVEILDDLNLCILNNGCSTRRTLPGQHKSCVDLSFCSLDVAASCRWECTSLTHGSDHYPILISLADKTYLEKSNPPLMRYNLSNPDWAKYSSSLEDKIDLLPNLILQDSVIPSPTYVSDCYENLVTAIISSADSCFPIKNSARSLIPPPPWWNQECSLAVKERNDAEKIYNEDMTVSNLSAYNHALAKSKRLLRSKKRAGWVNFCGSLSPSTPISVVWQRINRFRNGCSPSISSPITRETAELFFDKLAPPYVPSEAEIHLPSSSYSEDPFDAPFTIQELDSVLRYVHDSAPGIDGIVYSFLSRAGLKAKNYFLHLINYFYTNGWVPDQWKTQIIIPILKPGKHSDDPNGFRPIALSSVLAKLMEHLIKNRLEFIIESRNLLPSHQFGFRKGFGTMDSIGVLVSDIRASFSKNESVVAAFLDISAAYDNVLLPILRQKLQEMGIPVKMVQCIFSMLMSRSLILRVPGEDFDVRRTWKGLPQGYVLSPLLYNLYTADIGSCLNNDCHILQYADDIALYVTNKSIEAAASSLCVSLDSLNQWLIPHGMSLSAPKSSMVVFSRRRLIPQISVRIQNHCIPVAKKAKFLGVFLDCKLTGLHHLNYLVNRCERIIPILKVLAGVWWGAHPYTMKLVYNALIRSVLDYGSFLLIPCNKGALTRLDRIQAQCLRIILGCMKSSPTNAIQVECAEPPLALRRQYLASRFWARVITKSAHPLIGKVHTLDSLCSTSNYWKHKEVPLFLKSFRFHQNLDSPIIQFPKLPIYNFNYDVICFKPKIFYNIGISKNSVSADSLFNAAVGERWCHFERFFTDASKLTNSGCTGAAVYYQNSKIVLQFKCPAQSSVFTGECVAILEACLFIEAHSINFGVIFTDSLSCLQALEQNPFKSKLHSPILLQIKKSLLSCAENHKTVNLVWIPSHCGIIGNECVDALAKDAVNSQSVDLKYYQCQGYDLLSLPKKSLLSSWQVQWQNSSKTKGSFYSAIQPNVTSKPWFKPYKKLSKKVLSILCRLRIGHCCSPVFLHKIRVRDSSLCECGLDEGTLEHIFFNCTNNNPSLDLYSRLSELKIPVPINFPSLLTHFSPKLCSALIIFIRSNNIRL